MISNNERNTEVLSITIDKKTKGLLDEYAENHVINRSATIRMILNEFFLKRRLADERGEY